jgi:hypothetical protein
MSPRLTLRLHRAGMLPSAFEPWKAAFLVGFVLVSLICSAAFPSALDQTQGPQVLKDS